MSRPVVHGVKDHPDQFIFWCPGCECAHGIDARWKFNGDMIKPTLSPSVLSQGEVRCHSFVKNGRIEFLNDSQHKLAGKTVELTPFPWGDD